MLLALVAGVDKTVELDEMLQVGDSGEVYCKKLNGGGEKLVERPSGEQIELTTLDV